MICSTNAAARISETQPSLLRDVRLSWSSPSLVREGGARGWIGPSEWGAIVTANKMRIKQPPDFSRPPNTALGWWLT